ncbi:UNVERIFIED_CONTAM: Branched-chain-amino-acid aminotransferase-like protein 2, partial [Sesamum latifolium]
RDDTEVLDEPLYANFLRVTGAERPYREDFLSKLESDGNKVVKEIIFGPGQKKYRFCKPFPLSLYNLLEQSSPFYNLLKRYVRQTTARSFNPKLPVPANEKLLSWVGDEIVPRESAKVSVFDSVVQGGDAVWEGLRIYNGKVFKLEEHLDRLFDSAKALAFSNVPTREYVKEAIFKTLIRNGMFNNAHIRLTLTRGKKFLVKKGRVSTPFADYCLPGITRATVMELVVKENLVLVERNISLSEFHTADEVFTTGTMGELSPVIKIDGRIVGDGRVGPVTQRLQKAYANLTAESGVPIPTYQQT